jgi:gas vesicle protein GvpL/GvpF
VAPADAAATVADAPTYVYGVSRAPGALLAGAGLLDADVVPIVHDGLAAITSALPSAAIRGRRRDLLRHTEVLQTAFESGTIVPLRFGTVFARPAEVVDDFLAPMHGRLASLLGAFEGVVELTVRAFYNEEAVMREIVSGERGIERLRADLRSGVGHALEVRLGEAVVSALAVKRDDDARRVVSSLQPHARNVAVEERRAELEVVRAAFLVERGSLAAFDAGMDELARARGGTILFEYTGPLPPHHFVSLEGRWGS